jgi:predicted lipid-binding transport protein (Tim44 family)
MSSEDVVHLAAPNGTPAPVEAPTASATCASCGAPLAPDQRYCLACGQPASPVRLAFLDVLQGEYQPAAGVGIPGAPPSAAYYAPPGEPDGLLGALRRYSGLLALTGVLLASLLIGLLVGHWITGGNGAVAGKQVIEVKGLSGPLAAAPATTTGANGSGSSAASHSSTGSASGSHSSPQAAAKEEAKEASEVKAAKAPPPVQKTTSSQSLQKLNKSTGKQHAKEVNALIKGDEPIETGH